jgi:serine/threonine-protein kinase RsbW
VGGSYTLEGHADVDWLAQLHQLMERAGGDHPEIEPLDLAMLETALIEIAGNVVEHGTPPGQIRYSFHLEVTGEHLHGLLVETGDPVRMSEGEVEERDELSESGRGMGLAHAVLTELRYERRGDTNAWVMTRLLEPRQDQPGRVG